MATPDQVRLLSSLTSAAECLPFLLGDNQDIVKQEQVARGPAGDFPKDTGFLQEEEFSTLEQPARGRDEWQGLGTEWTNGGNDRQGGDDDKNNPRANGVVLNHSVGPQEPEKALFP